MFTIITITFHDMPTTTLVRIPTMITVSTLSIAIIIIEMWFNTRSIIFKRTLKFILLRIITKIILIAQITTTRHARNTIGSTIRIMVFTSVTRPTTIILTACKYITFLSDTASLACILITRITFLHGDAIVPYKACYNKIMSPIKNNITLSTTILSFEPTRISFYILTTKDATSMIVLFINNILIATFIVLLLLTR